MNNRGYLIHSKTDIGLKGTGVNRTYPSSKSLQVLSEKKYNTRTQEHMNIIIQEDKNTRTQEHITQENMKTRTQEHKKTRTK